MSFGSPVLVTDPFIKVRTAGGMQALGLHEVLNLAHSGELIDLPGMRADQRAPVVTVLAILSHLVRRYAGHELLTAGGWREAIVNQFGDTLILVGGAADRPQFLQPVLDMEAAQAISLTEVDHLMPAAHHGLKSVASGTPEQALFALMCSTWRHHGGKSHYAGARARHLAVLVGDGQTLGSEIVSLAAAYAAATPAIVGSNVTALKTLDHMLCGRWLTSS